MANLPDALTVSLRRLVLDAVLEAGRDGERCAYAFAVHRRSHGGSAVFGVVTPAGETLPLTRRLLAALRACACRLRGSTPITLGAAPGPEGLADAPVTLLWVELWRPSAQADALVRIGYPVAAAEFERTQVILVGERPAGWPP